MTSMFIYAVMFSCKRETKKLHFQEKRNMEAKFTKEEKRQLWLQNTNPKSKALTELMIALAHID